jgi:branched-subunit amino acid transport protein
MFVATYAVRASFIVFGQRLRFPPPVARVLVHVPVAVLTAIMAPEAIAPRGTLDLSLTNPFLVGTLVTGLLAWKSGRILLSVLASFAVFGVMHWSNRPSGGTSSGNTIAHAGPSYLIV